ncbi:hypothetical protein BH10ACT11_BH10ACT11_06030 [soil metagenome]
MALTACGSEDTKHRNNHAHPARADRASKPSSSPHASPPQRKPPHRKPSQPREIKPPHTVPVISRCDYHSPSSQRCGLVPAPDSCSLREKGLLADPHCTPGAIDPRVTQQNLGRTICRSGGYTDTVRPPTSYTTPLEFRLIRSYDLPIDPSRSELDHLVSLELGGAPSDPRNLFPEPYTRGAYTKDTVENQLHDAVCGGRMKLATAQRAIIDWPRQLPPGALPKNPPPLARKPKAQRRPPSQHPRETGKRKCDPNYSGACLNARASDYDCKGGDGDGPKYVQGPIRITGNDHFGLGTAGNKVACE